MKKIYKLIMMVLIVLISGIFLSGCTVSDEEISEYEQIISDADILISSREYASAMDKLTDALEIIPSRVDAVEKMVNIFLIKNRLEDALVIIDESGSELSGEDKGKLYILVGKKSYEYRDFDTALYSYQLAEEISKDEQILLGEAKVYLQKGEVEKAKKILGNNFEANNYIESRIILSYIQALSDFEEAKETVSEIEPGDEWRNEYSKWQSLLSSLTEDTLFNGTKQAKLYIDVGYPYLAVSALEPLEDEMSEYTDGQYLLGKAYHEVGQYQASVDILEESVSITDYSPYIYWILARDYYLLNDIETAFSYYDSAIATLGDDLIQELHAEYLNLLLKSNQTEKALEVMRIAEKGTDEPWVNLLYARIYNLREDYENQKYYLDQIEYEILSEEEKKEYLYSKGLYMLETSDYDELRRVNNIFWELDEYDPRYNLLVARLSFEEGNLEDARIYSKKAIEYDLQRVVTDDAQKLLAQID